jgi:hypothetical protein
MRDPVHSVDQVEADIEDTRRFLKGYVESETWKADPDGFAGDSRVAIEEVEVSNLPDWAKNLAILALWEQTKRRRSRKPTRRVRDRVIREAASRLVMTQGYKLTRNDVTRNTASAASIIQQALNRLGEKLSEKSINAVVLEIDAKSLIKEKVSPAFYEYLREHAGDILYCFESDHNAPEPVDSSGRPVFVLK